MKRKLITVLLTVFCTVGAFAQYNPPAGGADIHQFYSPLFLARGDSVTSLETPEADTMNPAVSGANQRSVLDLSYIGISGFNSAAGDGWLGHAANLGVSYPTRAGVISGSLHFLSSYAPSMMLGTNFGLRVSFAKDLYPYLLVGAGLNLDAGGLNTTSYGASVDLGALVLPGTIGPFQDLRWGIALTTLGVPYTPVPGNSPVPAAFTPAVGAAFNLIKTDSVRLGLSGNLSFPSFQDVRFNAGGTVSLFDTVDLNFGWQTDLRGLINPTVPRRSSLPSFGISVTFKTSLKGKSGFIADQGWNQSEVRTRVSAAPLYGKEWGIGVGLNAPLGVVDKTPPDISIDYPKTLYISPNNDGVQDALELPIKITDQRYVKGYDLKIMDDKGNLVREIKNKDARPENKGFQNVLDRLAAVKSGIEIPKTLRWDGTTNSGNVAPDGTYSFHLEAWDDNGNLGRSPTYEVILDNTPPSVTITPPSAEDMVFSPNGDGNKDTFAINQTGSAEDLWTGSIRDGSGKTVFTKSWNGAPSDFIWDGKGTDGETVPDGVYSYRIASTDRAGNTASAVLDNIIVNTQPTPVTLNIDNSYFSPNGDGVKDTVTLTPGVPVKTGIREWSLRILNAAGTAVRTVDGKSSAPDAFVFDGRNDAGTVLPEGVYTAALSVQYVNGNHPETASPSFTLDLTPPTASVKANYPVFSPNGDGNKDTITFFQDTSSEDLWTGTIVDSSGKAVKTYTWRGPADMQTVWDGREQNGALAPDGTYRYSLSSVDRAGNSGKSNTITFSVDTEATPVLLSAEYDAFSPNADGVKDQINLIPKLKKSNGIASYTLAITNDAGKTVRTLTGRNTIDGPFTWDGMDNNGQRVPDGRYQADLAVQYANGNKEDAHTAPFVLDTVYPSITLSTDYTLFSPDGDGNKDTITIRQTSSSETLWQGKILDSSGHEVKSMFWKGKAENFVWDGTDNAGNKVPDGKYRYVVTSQDQAGNKTERSIDDIVVDTRPASAFVTVDNPGFSPNGDGYLDSEKFSMYVNLLGGVESWKLSVIKQAADGSPEQVVREFTGTKVSASFSVTWDGKGTDGKILEGRYKAKFEVVYKKGNHPVAYTPDFLLDISPPKVELNLSPTPFSPDNDGVNDELHIKIHETDASAIRQWRFEILDRNNQYFTDFSGKGTPTKELIWDGRAKDGELVISAEDYPYVFTITDALGNTTVTHGTIPIDILVLREGDRLKVRISSITFTPNSPKLVLDNASERGVKNNEILKRLVQIFGKYSSYRIRIEGHAVNISGTQREQEQELIPLSLARAQSVKDALVERGLSANRISVAGLGDQNPIVPDTDLKNRWKNRRVEFILIK